MKLMSFIHSNVSKTRKLGPKKIMIMGLPNVGKSTIINHLNNRKVAKAENRPGVTKSVQWIEIDPDLILLDSPGVLLDPKAIEEEELILKLIGAIQYESNEVYEIVEGFYKILRRDYPNMLEQNLHKSNPEFEDWLIGIAKHKHFLVKGGELDTDRAARLVLQQYLSGKFGRVSFQKP